MTDDEVEDEPLHEGGDTPADEHCSDADEHRSNADEHGSEADEHPPEPDGHLSDVDAGAGCTEIWEHLSERRCADD